MDQLSPPKSVDPLTVLPRELAEIILDYLSFRQRMNACLVSKQWNHFIRSAPNLWKHLDLSGAKKKVRSAFISRAINVGRSKLTSATLSNLYDVDKTIAALVKHCPLEELTLLHCGYQTGNLVDLLKPTKRLTKLTLGQGTQFLADELLRLLSAMSEHIQTFECFSRGDVRTSVEGKICPNLTSFSLIVGHAYPRQLLKKIPELMPALQSLRVYQESASHRDDEPILLKECKQLRHLDLCLPFQCASWLHLPPNIVSLKLEPSDVTNGYAFLADIVDGLVDWPSLPCLTELTLVAYGVPLHHIACLLVAEDRSVSLQFRWATLLLTKCRSTTRPSHRQYQSSTSYL